MCVARQVAVSTSAATLIASDGRSRSVSLVDVFSGSVRKVDLPAPAGRLTVSASGQLVAATNPAGGTIALIDLGSGQVGTGSPGCHRCAMRCSGIRMPRSTSRPRASTESV
jgi:hypothetical protein